MSEQSRLEPKIFAAAERQMRSWVKTQEVEDQAVQGRETDRRAEGVQPYLTISREEGAGGSEIARAVGREIGWEVLDGALLDRVAQRLDVSRPMLAMVDETRRSWMQDAFGSWMNGRMIAAEKYVAQLGPVVLAATRQASVILVGRGAQFLLPPRGGVAVRIISSRKYRIDQVMCRENVGHTDAERMIDEVDEGRCEFVRRYFHREIDDPLLYDLVVNVESLGHESAIALIRSLALAAADR